MNWRIIKKLSAFFLAFLLFAMVADFMIITLVEYGSKGNDFVGCYAYDAMLVGFECQGFIGSPVVAAWLNWPLWLVLAPMFAFFNVKTFIVAVFVWLPLITYVVSIIKLRRSAHA
jgi:hypothetical protein